MTWIHKHGEAWTSEENIQTDTLRNSFFAGIRGVGNLEHVEYVFGLLCCEEAMIGGCGYGWELCWPLAQRDLDHADQRPSENVYWPRTHRGIGVARWEVPANLSLCHFICHPAHHPTCLPCLTHLPCLALPLPALPCPDPPALPCPALPCPAPPCPAPPCPACLPTRLPIQSDTTH